MEKDFPLLDGIGVENRRIYTLCFPLGEKQVLLGYKKRGFGANRWNGFGGKRTPDETIENAARRETREECGLICDELDFGGRLIFTFEDVAQAMEVHVFRAANYTGLVAETEEMRPRWFPLGSIPFDNMWADDRFWLPRVLQGSFARGHFHFKGDELLRYNLRLE